MKYPIFFIGILLLFLFSCGDDPSRPATPGDTARISGRVIYAGSSTPAEDATVYLFQTMFGIGSFVDSVQTEKDGEYEFSNLPVDPEYYTYARKCIGSGSPVCPFVSALSDTVRFFDPGSARLDDLDLVRIQPSATVSGQVVFEDNGLPADSADVSLYIFNGTMIESTAGTLTDSCGNYSFSNVYTGNYILWAGKRISPSQYLVQESKRFFCDGVSVYTIEQLELGILPVRKPAIYIYPEAEGYFEVGLTFNNGTVLTESVPEYGSGWDVFVERSGRIERQYDYLFYEAGLKYVPSLSEGWCVSRDDLSADLRQLLISIGLNEAEARDFIDYWRGVLTESSYYKICPIFDAAINRFVQLEVDPEPDTVLRVWLFFEGCGRFEPLPEPFLPSFQRGSTTVIEWGGVLLN